jgi:hypothetical protein
MKGKITMNGIGSSPLDMLDCSASATSRFLILSILVPLAGCSHTRSPSATVRAAYENCNAGKYSEAEPLMSKDLISTAASFGGVKTLCDINTRNGTIKDIATSGEEIRGESATVTMIFTFNDGTKVSGFHAPLIKEGGVWKVALKTN